MVEHGQVTGSDLVAAFTVWLLHDVKSQPVSCVQQTGKTYWYHTVVGRGNVG